MVALPACGSSENGGSDELARQHELAAARRQAAQDARQGARLQGLERQLRRSGQTPTSAPPAQVPDQAAPPAGPQLGDWPGGSAYTAILASDASRLQARAEQAEASGRGLDAGVLFSTDFSSLRPGYWVVFSGSFASQEAAASRAARAHELGYSDAYPRFVSP
jgi:hypothetical protein